MAVSFSFSNKAALSKVVVFASWEGTVLGKHYARALALGNMTAQKFRDCRTALFPERVLEYSESGFRLLGIGKHLTQLNGIAIRVFDEIQKCAISSHLGSLLECIVRERITFAFKGA